MKLKKAEIALLLLLILALCLWAFWPKSQGNTAIVTMDGETVLTLNLNQPGEYPVEGWGDFFLTVVVENGQVRVEDSTCPDLICQNHVPVSQAGEQIVCLPARIVVSVKSMDETEVEIDAIAG